MLDRMLLASTASEALYVEDVFSTYLYTGNGSTQTITNGIDLAGKGGLVWIKSRSAAADHFIFDTNRGASKFINTNNANAQTDYSAQGYFLDAFTSTGFTLDAIGDGVNQSGTSFASWTFRKAPKFFDVVTYTGTGSARTIAHSLGVAPGCIIVKRTDTTSNWAVYHRGNTSAAYYEKLNLTDAQVNDSTVWNSTDPTASVFSVGTNAATNASGGTYVAYLFAHDATADGIIQCGSYTGNGSSQFINLGWEPQFLLTKSATSLVGAQQQYAHWKLHDIMRGIPTGAPEATLYPNLAAAEEKFLQNWFDVNPTGFTAIADTYGYENQSGVTYIYIAIRRGPMRTPTVGTSVFKPTFYAASTPQYTSNFPVDMAWRRYSLAAGADYGMAPVARLTGTAYFPGTASTGAESSFGSIAFDYMNGYNFNGGVGNSFSHMFRRAPGFFDVVCYTGTGSTQNINHSLKAQPEVVIIKSRGAAADWQIFVRGAANTWYNGVLNSAIALQGPYAFDSLFTSSTFLNSGGYASGATYVAYLFGSCPGVSKVGSYTGNGSSQTINCGFSNGARFFLVKRTDSAGDWWVWDSAQGITASADPTLQLNVSGAAQVTGTDAVDPNSTGIIVNQEATCNINVNGATYIYLAIA